MICMLIDGVVWVLNTIIWTFHVTHFIMPQNVQLPLIFLQHQIINGSKDFNALSFLLFLMHMMGDFVLHSVQGDLLTLPGIFMK